MKTTFMFLILIISGIYCFHKYFTTVDSITPYRSIEEAVNKCSLESRGGGALLDSLLDASVRFNGIHYIKTKYIGLYSKTSTGLFFFQINLFWPTRRQFRSFEDQMQYFLVSTMGLINVMTQNLWIVFLQILPSLSEKEYNIWLNPSREYLMIIQNKWYSYKLIQSYSSIFR